MKRNLDVTVIGIRDVDMDVDVDVDVDVLFDIHIGRGGRLPLCRARWLLCH